MRSYLFVPADSPRKLEKSLISGADALIFDLEDAVSQARKPEGRRELRRFLSETGNTGRATPKLFVRVNALDTGMTLSDLEAVMPYSPAGIVLPKCRGAQDLRLLSSYLDVFQHIYPSPESTPTSIVAIVTETADSLAGLNEYRGSSSRLAGMMWGAEDLSGDIGALANTEEASLSGWTDPFTLVRSLCLFAAAAAGVQAIDTVPTEINNPERLLLQTQRAYRDGFTAKAAIHPGQVPVINQGMTPDIKRQEWARCVVAAFEQNTEVGVATLDGKMLDLPHLKLARRILAASGQVSQA